MYCFTQKILEGLQQKLEGLEPLSPIAGAATGVRGVTPGKILKFETQFGAIWCILARNLKGRVD